MDTAPEIQRDPDRNRFELTIDGATAYLTYQLNPGEFELLHTEVPPTLRGRHLGDRLVDAAIAWARQQHLRLNVVCPFARAYLKRHPPAAV